MAEKIQIGGELEPKTTDKILGDAFTIMDRENYPNGKRQCDVNKELLEAVKDSTGVAAETSRAKAAETALGKRIDDEETSRRNAINGLQTSILANEQSIAEEESRAIYAESVINSYLTPLKSQVESLFAPDTGFEGIFATPESLPSVSGNRWAMVGANLQSLSFYVHAGESWTNFDTTKTYDFTNYSNVVKYSSQSLSIVEKKQARQNIDAADDERFSESLINLNFRLAHTHVQPSTSAETYIGTGIQLSSGSRYGLKISAQDDIIITKLQGCTAKAYSSIVELYESNINLKYGESRFIDLIPTKDASFLRFEGASNKAYTLEVFRYEDKIGAIENELTKVNKVVFTNNAIVNSAIKELYIESESIPRYVNLILGTSHNWLQVYDSNKAELIAQFPMEAAGEYNSVLGSATYARIILSSPISIPKTQENFGIDIYAACRDLSNSPMIYGEINYAPKLIKGRTSYTDDIEFNEIIKELYIQDVDTTNLKIRYARGVSNNWIQLLSNNVLQAQFKYIPNSVVVDEIHSRSYCVIGYASTTIANLKTANVDVEYASNLANNPMIAAYIGEGKKAYNTIFEYDALLLNNIMKFGNFKDYADIDYASDSGVASADFLDYTFADFQVGTGMCTAEFSGVLYQSVAYYDVHHQMCVALRKKSGDKWGAFEIKRLDSFIGWDSHNYVTTAIDNNGYIHVSGNMHDGLLIYFRSKSPLSISTMERKFQINVRDEWQCTYPAFLKTSDKFIFSYRDGYSGNGDLIFNTCSNGTWSRLAKVVDGKASKDSAYFTNGLNTGLTQKHYNPNTGYYEFAFLWRSNDTTATHIICHDIVFFKTRDFNTFYKYDNTQITLPISVSNNCNVLELSGNDGFFNGIFSSNPVKEGQLIAYHALDNNGKSQIYAMLVKDGSKTNPVKLTTWNKTYVPSGTGTITSLTSPVIGEIGDCIYNGQECYYVVCSWENEKYRYVLSKNMVLLTKDTNFPSGNMPAIINQMENTSGLVYSRKVFDLYMEDKHLMRYESMPTNNDKPRIQSSALPSAIKIIEII